MAGLGLVGEGVGGWIKVEIRPLSLNWLSWSWVEVELRLSLAKLRHDNWYTQILGQLRCASNARDARLMLELTWRLFTLSLYVSSSTLRTLFCCCKLSILFCNCSLVTGLGGWKQWPSGWKWQTPSTLPLSLSLAESAMVLLVSWPGNEFVHEYLKY